MAVTILYDDAPYTAQSATFHGEDLWISDDDLRAATGWERKPQGLCLGERCVPIPPGRSAAFVASDGRFNLAEFARLLEQPVVHDDAADVWLFGATGSMRRDERNVDVAPNFRLPDLDGTIHALSDFRGKKVLLLSWASW